MEIQTWFYIFIVNCFMIPNLESKTFSLNEAIAAEAQLKSTVDSTVTPAWSEVAQTKTTTNNHAAENTKILYSLKQRLASKLNKSKFQKRVIPREVPNFLAPLAYKKKFKISSPLRPKKLTVGQNLRFKRKNTATKREIKNIGNEKLREKYVPLLKSLSMLFDNLLDSDGDRSNEIKTKKDKRNRFYSPELFDIPCNCTNNNDSGDAEYNQDKKTNPVASSFSTKIPIKVINFTVAETTTAPSDTIATRNFGTFRQHKNLPLLLSRNTLGSRRTNTRNGKGSSTALHGDIQGNISGDNRSYEPNTRKEKYYSNAKNDEKYTDSVARVVTSSARYAGTVGDGDIVGTTKYRDSEAKNNKSKIKNSADNIGKNQFKNRRIEKEIPKLLSKPFGGIRRIIRDNEVTKRAKSLQSQEVRKKGDNVIAHNVTSNTRITIGGGTIPTKVQEVRSGNETIMSENETVTNGNETITSGNDTVLSGNDTVLSGNNTVSCENETITSGNETDTSRNEIIISGNETVPSGNKSITSRNGTKTSGNETTNGNLTITTSGKETVSSGKETVSSGNETDPSGGETDSSENETITSRNESVTDPTIRMVTNNTLQGNKKPPVVMIFDGYSVTRHKNGENKLSEKSIRII